MRFPTKLDENINLLAKNNRFSELEKATLLLNSMTVHDELPDDDRKYGEAVAAGWLNKAGEQSAELLQWLEYYGKIRAGQMNGIPTSMLNRRGGFDEGSSRFEPKTLLKGFDYHPVNGGFKCRDCHYIAKTSNDSECFEHTKRTGHNTGFDLLK